MRAKQFPKRDIKPDPKFNNTTVAKFINLIMSRGKKALAQKIVYKTFDIISEKEKADPLEVFEKALKNVSPVLEVISRRIGGANYQIPVEVRGDRRMTLAMRWIIKATTSKKGQQMPEKLANELILAAKKEGAAMSKKEEMHRMAESNRAFAHFGRS